MLRLRSAALLAITCAVVACGGQSSAPPACTPGGSAPAASTPAAKDAPAPSTAPDSSTPTVQKLAAREQEFGDDMKRRDATALDGIVAAEFELTTAKGITPRDTWMDNAVNKMDHKAVEVRDVRATRYGDTAVVKCTLHWHVVRLAGLGADPRTHTSEIDSDFFLTDVWVRRDARWQIVARHSTIPLPKTP